MSAPDWQRVKNIFALARKQPMPMLPDFLNTACAGDSALRAEVESLLEADDEPESLFDSGNFGVAALFETDGPRYQGETFGHYRILHEIGRGGMGAVFLAERSDGEFQQKVALKIIRHSFAGKELERRFRRERQILASLNHPNIARLLDGGVGKHGEPFLTMEYVEGEPLFDFARNGRLNIEERLRLFLKICDAVSFAHRNLIIHRDIKSSNIMVTPDGEPKLLDFGLARVLDESFAIDYTQTETAFRAFTPSYASPEQIRGQNVTIASDIYSLGVVLYELLTGARPFNFEGKSLERIIKTVTEFEPGLPSRALGTGKPNHVRSGRHPQKEKSDAAHLEGDIDNIVLMALRKEPERRYKSIEAFAEDIERFLHGWPITARPNTLRYRGEKFVRRNTLGVIAASLIFLSVVAGIAATLWQARTASEQARVASVERDRARLEADKAARISAFLQSMMLTASPNWNTPGFGSSIDVTLIEVIDQAAQRIKTEFAEQPESLAKIQRSLGLIYAFRGRYEEGESQIRAAFELSLRLYGEEHPETLQNARDLAGLLMLKGEYVESGALYQKALVIYRKRLNEGRLEGNTLLGFAGTLSDVGLLHRLKGEPKIAERFLHESLQQSDKLSGSARAVVAIPLSHLGMARYEQGDLDDAEKYVRQSIAEFRGLPGNLRVETGGTLLNLSRILMTNGDYKQAEIQIRECLELYRQRLGKTHPYMVNAVSHLSHLEYLKGDYGGAGKSAAEALELSRQTLPERHPAIAYPLVTLGLILTARGQAASGEKHLREAWEIRKRAMIKGSWLIAETEGALGECLTAQKRFAEAETLLLESYESLKLSQVKETHTKSAKDRLAALYTARGKPDLAILYR
ncbi:MAG: protein kinase domain-containing protein [Pyrinomonadaceae bacterium]